MTFLGNCYVQSMNKWLVVIADIIDSRRAANRQELQNALKHALGVVNARSESVVSPYTITLGDEFQAVLKSSDGLFADLWSILACIHPYKMRFSIAIGSISTDINTSSSVGMDGEAFYLARDAIVLMKKSKLPVCISGMQGRGSALANDSLNLVMQSSRNWSRNRIELQARLLGGENAGSIHREMSISKSAVYQNIRNGSLNLTTRIQGTIAGLMNEELQN